MRPSSPAVMQRGFSPTALRKALVVFSFLSLLAVHTYSGFLYELAGGISPRPLIVIDDIIDVLLVSWLGPTGAAIALFALAVGLALLVFVRTPVTDRAQKLSQSKRR